MADNEHFTQTAEQIYHQWDKALADNDVEGLLALYAPRRALRESGGATRARYRPRCLRRA
jgi:hypothetical protein